MDPEKSDRAGVCKSKRFLASHAQPQRHQHSGRRSCGIDHRIPRLRDYGRRWRGRPIGAAAGRTRKGGWRAGVMRRGRGPVVGSSAAENARVPRTSGNTTAAAEKGTGMVTPSRSDALALFGVTGDLAHKMIFPALYAMVKRGVLKVPVIGVAFPKWSLARLRKRVVDSVRRSGGIDNQHALDRLLSLLRYVSGDYKDPGTFAAL